MTSLGLGVDVVETTYIESALADCTPHELATIHSQGKAAGAQSSSKLIIAADTVVDLDGTALGKPRDLDESRWMIERLAGREHSVHTAFTLRDDSSGQRLTECQTTRVRFAALSSDVIDAYVASGDGLDKAGAYGIQGFGATLVASIHGDYFTVVGFPLAAFASALPRIGYQLRPPPTPDNAVTTQLNEVSA